MATKKPTAAQLAARQRFADMARAGVFAKNPAKRKKAAKPVTRPSQATGRAPSKRLVKRRKLTAKAPPGYFANPAQRYSETFDVEVWERMRNSANGNPRFRFVLRDVNGRIYEGATKPDSSFVFGLPSSPAMLHATLQEKSNGKFVMTNAEKPAGGYSRNPLTLKVPFESALDDAAAPEAMRDFGEYFFVQWRIKPGEKWTTHRIFETLGEAEKAAKAMHRNHPDSYIRVVNQSPATGRFKR